jgi:predicted phage terminase large subunit-like protein
MGEIRVGDVVFAPDGTQTVVEWVSAIMQHRPCFRVVFDTGESIIADDEHLWATRTDQERTLASKDEAWRLRRRAARPKRGTGARPDLAARNSAKPTPLADRSPRVRTTGEIRRTLRAGRRTNHSIDVIAPVDTAFVGPVPVDAYVLGVWLGDGTRGASSITTADAQLIEELEARGEKPRRVMSARYAWTLPGLAGRLRLLDVLKEKKIPESYLRASVGARTELLCGLMDTDGFARPNGGCEFTTTSPLLRDGMMTLLGGLGIKAGLIEGVATLNGRAISAKWRICFTSPFPCFRLARKLARQRMAVGRLSTRRRFIVDVQEVESVPVRCLGVAHPGRCFCVGRGHIPTHNSWALLLDPLRHAHKADFRAVYFRRTMPDLRKPGGLWDTSRTIYPLVGARPRDALLEWHFPSSAWLKMGHLEHDKDRYDHQGAQYAWLGFDELTHFSARAFWYLWSRARAPAHVCRPTIRATCNPDPDSWVFDLVEWYLTPEGFPDPEKVGLLRYFLRGAGDRLEWRDDPAAFVDVDDVKEHASKEGMSLEAASRSLARSFTFIPARLDDNPSLGAEYRAALQALPYVERMRLLSGNWAARETSGTVFREEWLAETVDLPPLDARRVRFWDLAGSKKRRSDFTAGVLVSLTASGVVVVEDVRQAKGTPAETEALLRETAERDGRSVEIWIEEESGASGMMLVDHLARHALKGFTVAGSKISGDKLVRAKPVSAAAEQGRIMLRQGASWRRPFLAQLQAFPDVVHDDMVDAFIGSWHQIQQDEFAWATVTR